jgi:hypothetical protein
MIFLKIPEILLEAYLIDLIEFISQVRKKLPFYRKKTAKGVDNPI